MRIELHQCAERGFVDRLTIRKAGERRKYFRGASLLVCRRSGPADEYFLARRSIPGAGRSERPFDGQAVDRWVAHDVEAIDRGSDKGLDHVVPRCVAFEDGGRPNSVRSCLHRHSEGQALVEIRSKRSGVFGHLQKVFTTAGRHQFQADTVHGDFDIVRILHSAHEIERVPPQPDLERVFAIEREIVLNENSASGARRQSLDVLILGEIRPHAIDRCRGRYMKVADGRAADVPGGRQIAFHQRW